MAKLSTKDRETARGFLLDLFWMGGMITSADTNLGNNLDSRWSGLSGQFSRKAAQLICAEIKFRAFDFFNIDQALKTLSSCKFFADPNAYGRVRGARMITRTAEQLASYIADFCKTNQIYWDDVHTNRTTYEMEQYKKTLLGGALWEYNCFLSQNMGTDTSAPQQPKVTNSTTPATPRAQGQPPKNNYKSLGPQSGNVRDLHGVPGYKVLASATGNLIFCIVGHNAKSVSSPAYAFIKPLSKGGAVGTTNKVFIGSSHGYSDCTCYFDDLNLANDFLIKCQAICPAHITNLQVAKKSAERNGYFLVGTEFGEVAISAKRLNEAIIDEELNGKSTDTIKNIEAYEEAFYKYE